MVYNKDNAAECLQAIDRFIGFKITIDMLYLIARLFRY